MTMKDRAVCHHHKLPLSRSILFLIILGEDDSWMSIPQCRKKQGKNFLLISSLSLFKLMVEIAPNKKLNSIDFLLAVHQQELMQPFTTQYFRVTFSALFHY